MNIGEQNVNILDDDIFLVSYPKSGNTWVRFLIGNYLTGNKCDFSNSHLIIPGMHYNPEQINKLESPRFIKTHGPFAPSYKRIIYIVRDVRDVAVSYFFYALKFRLIDKNTTFKEFLTSIFDNGVIDSFSDWSTHVKSYIENRDENFLLVKYEDLIQDPVRELTRIVTFSNLVLRQEDIVSAVEASSFTVMQKMERSQFDLLEKLKKSDPSIQFIRKGKVGVWKDWFDGDLLAYVIEKHGEVMQQLNYISPQLIDLQKQFFVVQKSLVAAEERLIHVADIEKEISLRKADLVIIQDQLSKLQNSFSSAQKRILEFGKRDKSISEENSRLKSNLSLLEKKNTHLKNMLRRVRTKKRVLIDKNRKSKRLLKELRISGRRDLIECQLIIDDLSSKVESFESSNLWKFHSYWMQVKRKLLLLLQRH